MPQSQQPAKENPTTEEGPNMPPPQPPLPHELQRTQNAVLLFPPNYPPYEDRIDMRIPMHFTSFDEVKSDRTCEEYSTSRAIGAAARELCILAGFYAMIILVRPRPNPIQNEEEGPLFFAIHAVRKDLHRWSTVHEGICEIIRDAYPGRDPPFVVRWLVGRHAVGL